MELTIEFGKCLGGTFAALGRYFGSFLMLIVGWFALGIAVFFGAQAGVVVAMEQWPEFAQAVGEAGHDAQTALVLLPLAFVSIPGTISMVVGWHRRIIRGVIPESPFPIGLGSILAYMGRGIVAIGIPALPAALGLVGLRVLFPPDEGESNPIVFVVILVAVLAVFLVAMRLSVMLPAIAVGDRSLTWAQGWKLTKGNTLRLFFGAILAALPFNILGNIIDKITTLPSVAEGGALYPLIAASVFVEMMGYASVAGFFSLAYVQLREALDDTPPAQVPS